jgi:hypothetical protein
MLGMKPELSLSEYEWIFKTRCLRMTRWNLVRNEMQKRSDFEQKDTRDLVHCYSEE